jgi:hypothetical protein
MVSHPRRVELHAGGCISEGSNVRFFFDREFVSDTHSWHCRIFYPIQGDQPGNAALMSVGHEAAFELLTVRSWIGEKIPYRCRNGPAPDFSVKGVKNEMRTLLERMKGEDGKKVRDNMERLGEAYRKTWKEGGESRANLEIFLKKFID